MKTLQILPLLSMLICLHACRKTFDHPPLTVAGEGQLLNIAQLKGRVKEHPSIYKFTGGDSSLYCTVTADESSGSFYRQIFVRDTEGEALQVNLLSSGGIYTGDYIRISLRGAVMKYANNAYSLDSVSTANNIVKISTGHAVVPVSATIARISGGVVSGNDLQGQLVQLDQVEFIYEDRNMALGDAIGKSRKDLTLTDCNGYTITLTTSGFANFAAKQTPAGNGRVTALVSRYNNSMRLELRSFNDLVMPGSACTSSSSAHSGTFVPGKTVQKINENFSGISDNTEFAGEGWINYNARGKSRWKGNVKQTVYKTIRTSAFGAGEKCETWLISPPVQYQPMLKLSFKTGVEYFKSGHQEAIMAYISTNFNGLNFGSANWTPLTEAIYAGEAAGNYNGAGGLRHSGTIALKNLPLFSNYSGTFFLGFRYSGEPGFDSNVYLDDVVVE